MAVITISRGTFSGGQNLAECVAQKLGHRCLARAVVHEAALRYGVSEERLVKAMEESPGVFERLTSERARYLTGLRAALVKEIRTDDVVYHGLAGHFLLENVPGILRIRVIANMEFRIKAAMDRRKIGRDEAIHLIRRLDEQRIRWTRFLYHSDWGDPLLYDLVINLDHISLDSACDIVCHMVSLPEFKRTPQSQNMIDGLVLSTEIKARIATNKDVAGFGVEVEASNGVVTLGGTVASLEDADKIREIVRDTPGVGTIDSKMKVGSPW